MAGRIWSHDAFHAEDSVCLVNGDCLELMPLAPVHRARLVLADPPYLIGGSSVGKPRSKSGTWQDLMNSARWYASWIEQAARLLRPDGFGAVFSNWRGLPVLLRALDLCGLTASSCVAWDKQWIGTAAPSQLRPSWELILVWASPDARIARRDVADVFPCKWMASQMGESGHPAEKPVALLEQLIELLTEDGDLVVDPFAGSGSTLVAARHLGRVGLGFEAELKWCERAVERLAQMPLEAAR